jgi:hypothetical protein
MKRYGKFNILACYVSSNDHGYIPATFPSPVVGDPSRLVNPPLAFHKRSDHDISG